MSGQHNKKIVDAVSPAQERRAGGAALIVVLAMTGMLMFLGFFFFSFISVERNSASFFATSNSQMVHGDYFDFALQQVLIGPTDDLVHSSLYGRKWSIVPNMVGSLGPDLRPQRSMQPFSGRGIHIRYQGDNATPGVPTGNNFAFDYDGLGGTPDFTNPDLKVMNFSPAANGLNRVLGNFVPDFEPDAGYTYPDINSMFLGHFSLVEDPSDPSQDLKKVWIPSFHRPQYLPRNPTVNIFTNGQYRNRVLRPHVNNQVRLRRFDIGAGGVQSVVGPRYVGVGGFNTAFTSADSGPATAFPFQQHFSGVWHDASFPNDIIQYDVDADGIAANGREAILMDLDHRVETMADGTKRIPMYAITIMDADALLNLNLAGNLLGEDQQLAHAAGSQFGNGRFVTKSNLGLSPSELNLGRAFYRPLSGPTSPHPTYQNMFSIGAPLNQTAISNMEVARLLLGVPEPQEIIPGRWGERQLLQAAISGGGPPAPALPRMSWSWLDFPAPGRAAFDDNDNYGTGGGKAQIAGAFNQDRIFGPLGISIPPGVHPIDPIGAANVPAAMFSNSFVTADRNQALLSGDVFDQMGGANNFGKLRMARQPILDNPGKWPAYSGRWELQSPTQPAILEQIKLQTGVVPWHQANLLNPMLPMQRTMTNGADNYFLADEPEEVIVEPAFRNLEVDSVFSVTEMPFLHYGEIDWSNANMPSRLESLVRFNFDRSFDLGATPHYNDGWWLRSQFTTDSWDRWEFGMSPAVGNLRQWEFSPFQTQRGPVRVFPPQFAGAPRFSLDFPRREPFAPAEYRDPFRPEVYQWLRVILDPNELLPKNPAFFQRKLNMNRLLVKDQRGRIFERHLTPHPAFLPGETDANNVLERMYQPGSSVVQLHGPEGPAGLEFSSMGTNKFVQEWWAKYDRQRLARDIYVLLYTLGAGEHGFDPTQQPYPVTAETDLNNNGVNDQVEAMAQFAVNYVDALDRDSVITEFIYDINLSNGWNITGEKDANGDLTESEARRVYGVEAQQLTLNEALWIRSQGGKDDDEPVTIWDDEDVNDRHFLYLELLNSSPFDVELDRGTWRIRRIDVDGDNDDAETPVAGFRITDNRTLANTLPNGLRDTANIVEAGSTYTIGHHDGNNPADGGSDQRSSDFRVETAADSGQYQVIAPAQWAHWRSLNEPAATDPSENADPWVDLDLSWDDASETPRVQALEIGNNYRDWQNPDPGYLLNNDNLPPSGQRMRFVLERRLNATLGAPIGGIGAAEHESLERANPWVEVSRIELFEPVDFDPENPQYGNLTSQQRSQPLSPVEPIPYDAAARGVTGQSYNSLGEANTNVPQVNGNPTFTLWQPHFDRDFTSVYELLSVPLFGPHELKTRLTADLRLNGRNAAVSKMTIPTLGNAGGEIALHRNHWYRILEFLEVPSQVHAHIREQLPYPRTPGKINLNTIRHPGVLAALIDDDYHLRNFEQITVPGERFPYAQLADPHEPNRHWYEQMLLSRDRVDPVTGMTLPGIPGARPFRPLSYVDTTGTANAEASVEHTLLRSLPLATGGPMAENNSGAGAPGTGWTAGDLQSGIDQALGRRGLFEARTNNDAAFNGVSIDAVDYHSRNRLLHKIGNNTTVRSNVFYCWVYVQFHEAAEDEFGNAQVGGPLDTTAHPPKRAFFVLDRSKLEEAWDPRTRSFDWRKFVTFRKVLQ